MLEARDFGTGPADRTSDTRWLKGFAAELEKLSICRAGAEVVVRGLARAVGDDERVGDTLLFASIAVQLQEFSVFSYKVARVYSCSHVMCSTPVIAGCHCRDNYTHQFRHQCHHYTLKTLSHYTTTPLHSSMTAALPKPPQSRSQSQSRNRKLHQ